MTQALKQNLETSLLPFRTFRVQAIVIIVIGLIFYGNSLFNRFALDDGVTILQNDYVKQGFEGLGEIMTSDAYESYYGKTGGSGELSGGRYRPLSIVTFAIEQEFFGDNTFVRHLVNVLLYILSVVLLLYFLRQFVFPERMDLAFITALIFLIHPIHTEVVANIKSRDEIMSFLFIVLTFIYAFRYDKSGKIGHLIAGVLFFFLGLLSKEYGLTLLGLLPLAYFVFAKHSPVKSILRSLPYFGIAALYIFIRINMVGFSKAEASDVLNDPYLFASPSEELGSKLRVTDRYLELLVFPHPLSADYAYSHFQYRDFSDPVVWMAVIIHVGLILLGIWLLLKRKPLGWAIFFYLGNLLLVCNLLLDVGATMGERLIYHSSLGFAMAASLGLFWALGKVPRPESRKWALFGIISLTLILAGIKTITRNAEWKDDRSLFLADVQSNPNSAMLNGNAGTQLILMADEESDSVRKRELLQQAVTYINKSIAIHPRYVNSLINLGLAYYRLEDFGKAEALWDEAKVIFPTNKDLAECYKSLSAYYLNKGLQYGVDQEYSLSIDYMEKARTLDPGNPKIVTNLAGAFYTLKEYSAARQYWEETLRLDPNDADAKRGLEALDYLESTLPPDSLKPGSGSD